MEGKIAPEQAARVSRPRTQSSSLVDNESLKNRISILNILFLDADISDISVAKAAEATKIFCD